MALAREGIAFIVTYRCNLSCPHCFFDGRSSRQSLEPPVIGEALRSLDGPLRWVHFTGGEPFLDVARLMRLLDTARTVHAGDIGIASNGYWGTDAARARTIAAEAHARGVNGISLSIDAFHQPWVSHVALENAARAVAEAGMSRHSWLVLSLLSQGTAEAEATNEASRALARGVSERTGLPVAETPIRPIGRGSGFGRETAPHALPDGPCRDLACCLGETGPFDPRMIWIDPYGNVMICYGIVIGNLRDASLAAVLERYDAVANPVTRTLAEEGPIGLYRMACARGRAPAQGPFRDECDLCFRSRLALRRDFPAVLLPDECYPTP